MPGPVQIVFAGVPNPTQLSGVGFALKNVSVESWNM
jgi:hypothetical protein